MKYTKVIGVAIIMFLLFPCKIFSQNYKEVLTDDLFHLINKYQSTSLDSMRGNTTELWNEKVSLLKEKVEASENYIDYVYALRYFGRLINDAHAAFPDGGFYNRNVIFSKNDTLLPLWVKNWKDGRTFLVKDYTGRIPEGSEILTINDISAKELSLIVKDNCAAEDRYAFPLINEREQGDIRSWTNISNHLFMEKVKPPFKIEYTATNTTEVHSVILEGKIRHEIFKEYKKSGDKRQVNKSIKFRKTPIEHKHINDSISVLTINVFYGKNPLNLLFSQKDNRFERLLKKSMKAIHKNGSKHLIIDLRGNPGGYIGDVFHTMNYLTTDTLHEYTWLKVSEESKKRAPKLLKNTYKLLHKKNNREKQEESIRIFTEMPNGSIFRLDTLLSSNYIPETNLKYRYTGKVYVLTDALSYSGSILFCGLMKQVGRGLLCGESSGGYINQRGGMSVDAKSNYWPIIRMKVPYSLSSTLPDWKSGEKYLDIDHEISMSIEDWINNKDVVLDDLILLIK